MKNRFFWLLAVLCLNSMACRDKGFVDEYSGIIHRGQKDIAIREVSLDTLFVDGSHTSLDGEWHLNGDKLYFIDRSLVGVKEFALDGQYIGSHIERGRGPNEVLQSMLAGDFTGIGDFVAMDRGWTVSLFNKDFEKKKSYLLFEDLDNDAQVWDDLMKNPDPEEHRMYEFFINSKSIRFLKDQIIIPVITEHVDYNGFYKTANSQNFWLESYNFLMIDIENGKTGKLFGHYPPIFRESNMPAFSLLNFDTGDGYLYCSYGADSLIYVRDIEGKLVKCMGFAASSVKGEYPETSTFEEYSQYSMQHRKKYGYYKQIKAVNGYLFRSYKKDGDAGYGLQIYKGENLVGDVDFAEELYVIGYAEGFYYGVLPVDMEAVRFRIVRFKLNIN